MIAIKIEVAHRVTDEELLRLSELNPGYQFERTAEGRIIVSPTGGESGRRSAKLVHQLERWNEQKELGVVFDSSTGFGLPDGSVLSPDASWMRRERWEALSREEREGFVPLCPDAVFEIRSRFQSLAELREKMNAYLANGASLAVLIDPPSRGVEVYRPGGQVERRENPPAVSLDPELPGFILELAAIFGEK